MLLLPMNRAHKMYHVVWYGCATVWCGWTLGCGTMLHIPVLCGGTACPPGTHLRQPWRGTAVLLTQPVGMKAITVIVLYQIRTGAGGSDTLTASPRRRH